MKVNVKKFRFYFETEPSTTYGVIFPPRDFPIFFFF